MEKNRFSDYSMYGRQNRGYKYILVVIDVYSSRNWVKAQKTLTSEETAASLKEIIESMEHIPSTFSSDGGKEYAPRVEGKRQLL